MPSKLSYGHCADEGKIYVGVGNLRPAKKIHPASDFPNPARISIDPFSSFILVEASHAKAHARATAFFSYIWLKYDILSLHCCKLHSVVIIMLSYQPSAPGFDSRLGSECVMQYAGTGKEMHQAKKPCITVRVGAGMPA